MENLATVISSKAMISKIDKRFASFVSVEGDSVKLELEGIGMRIFPLETVKNGFTAIMDNESLIKNFVGREIKTGSKLEDKMVFDIAVRTGDILRKRFKDIDDSECFKYIKELYS